MLCGRATAVAATAAATAAISYSVSFASFAVAPDSTSSYTLIPSVLVVLPAPVSASRSNVFCGYINQTVDFGSRMLPVPQMRRGEQ